MTFRVDDSGKSVIPEKLGGKASVYEDFVAALPPHECRYGGERTVCCALIALVKGGAAVHVRSGKA